MGLGKRANKRAAVSGVIVETMNRVTSMNLLGGKGRRPAYKGAHRKGIIRGILSLGENFGKLHRVLGAKHRHVYFCDLERRRRGRLVLCANVGRNPFP